MYFFLSQRTPYAKSMTIKTVNKKEIYFPASQLITVHPEIVLTSDQLIHFKTSQLFYDHPDTKTEKQQCEHRHWDGPRRRSVILPLVMLFLLLSNAAEEVTVCVKSLQDILFQLWRNENTPGNLSVSQRERGLCLSLSLCSKWSQWWDCLISRLGPHWFTLFFQIEDIF